MKEENTKPRNPLAEAYQNLLTLPKTFREEISRECGWSEATFYRRINKRKPFPKSEIRAITRTVERLANDQLNTINPKI